MDPLPESPFLPPKGGNFSPSLQGLLEKEPFCPVRSAYISFPGWENCLASPPSVPCYTFQQVTLLAFCRGRVFFFPAHMIALIPFFPKFSIDIVILHLFFPVPSLYLSIVISGCLETVFSLILHAISAQG
ncbi:hypothetical protein AVEN_49465-1 [Araneus ventricosus]|uniref:Uncharacterized protein n=1 Tax=Araneus ventricosus TaxID=182803 RepID=A0A4Y2CNU6_ARAVE|nr:hypothetical protein AVEN_49465-1 [Araneus ventricosus]